MGKETDIKQDVEASLAALQRLRARRAALYEEIQEIDQSLESLQKEISEILGLSPPPSTPPAIQVRAPVKKSAVKDGEFTVNEAVLQVIQEARKEISKSDIRIRAMKLAGAFSESALNAALTRCVDEKEIRSTSRGHYATA